MTAGRPVDPAPDGFAVARSIRWNYGMSALSAVAQIGFATALARLLTPEDFGTVAVATGVLRFLQYLADLGLSSVVIQKPDFRADTDAPILFATGVGVSLLFAAALWLIAPLALPLLPDLRGDGLAVLRALACIGVLTAAGQVARALLVRRLDFRTSGTIVIASIVVGHGLAALPLAMLGLGPWSLVAGLAAQAAIGTGLAWRAAPHRLLPRGGDGRRWRSLLLLGGGFSTLRVLDSAGLHLLPIAVGTLAGVAAVGRWDRAWVLAFLPVEMLATGLGRVLFPAFSRLAADPEALRRTWLSVLMLSACLLWPVAAGIAVAAPEIVRVMLGDGWAGTAELVPLLALWAVLRGMAQFTGGVCDATGRLALRGVHQAAYLVALLLVLSAARPTDAAGIATALVCVDAAAQAVLLVLAARVVGVPARTAFARLAVGGAVTPVVAVACFATLTGLRSVDTDATLSLTAAIAVCAAALLLSVALHPTRSLRHGVARHVLGQGLGIDATGGGRLSRFRRFLER